MKKILIGIVALIAVGAMGFGARYYLGARKRAGAGEANASPVPVKVAYVDVNELTVRLADTDAEHYIRITPVLAVLPAEAESIEQTIPIVRDRIVTIVTACSSTELATPEGARKLKGEMLDALRQRFGHDVIAVYFNEYLVE